jgi:molybdate transport system ATP-binding protein
MFCEHRLDLKAALGAMKLEMACAFTAPWTVLFGASGSGKSSVLRGMCGLLSAAAVSFERFEKGEVSRLDRIAVERRDLSYAPQGASVFPHLNVAQNVGFAMKVCREPPKDSTLVEEAMSLFRLHALAGRPAAELSGGERQRVALARAFAMPGAKLMLLDEPFSGLDRSLRDELLPEMQAWLTQRAVQCVSVTHDVDEALLLGAEVLRMESGRVLRQGTAADVLSGERERLLRALGAEASS